MGMEDETKRIVKEFRMLADSIEKGEIKIKVINENHVPQAKRTEIGLTGLLGVANMWVTIDETWGNLRVK